jgi:hypothetical protein
MIEELKAIIGLWLTTQIFIVPLIFISEDGKCGLIVDIAVLALLIIVYFGLKLMGVV